MQLPDYWLTRPGVPADPTTQASFDHLLDETLARGPNAWIDYTLSAPKWQFLCHATERHGLVAHGSGNPSIDTFEPRQPIDLTEFGNQKAIYAASDGIWAMFFAVVDRDRYDMSVANGCVRLADAQGQVSGPYYVFSVSQRALALRPWRTGTVYLLPGASFVTQPPMPFGDAEVRIAQLVSLEPVEPIARLQVSPDDFPFLAQIRAHDDERLAEVAAAMQTGGAWPET